MTSLSLCNQAGEPQQGCQPWISSSVRCHFNSPHHLPWSHTRRHHPFRLCQPTYLRSFTTLFHQELSTHLPTSCHTQSTPYHHRVDPFPQQTALALDQCHPLHPLPCHLTDNQCRPHPHPIHCLPDLPVQATQWRGQRPPMTTRVFQYRTVSAPSTNTCPTGPKPLTRTRRSRWKRIARGSLS